MVRAVERLAKAGVLEVGHRREVARRLEREPIAPLAAGVRAGARCFSRGLRQPRELHFAVDEELEAPRRVEDVLAVAEGERRELHVNRGEARLAGDVELRAAPPEVLERLGQEALSCARERPGLRGPLVLTEHAEQSRGEGDAREELAHPGLDRRVCGAKLGRRGDGLEVGDDAHGVAEALADSLEGAEGVLVGARAVILLERRLARGGLGEERIDGGLHVLGADGLERNGGVARQREQRVLHYRGLYNG